MKNERKEIAIRLRGLREAEEISVKELAEATGVTPEEYLAYESGEKDIPMSYLSVLADYCKVELTQLLTGSDARMKKYFLTRRGTGPVVERRKAYHYEALGAQFADKAMLPFVVTVEPGDGLMKLNTHPGQEFNLVLEGRLEIEVDGSRMTLNPGDSLYYDAMAPHGMLALDGRAVRFLSVITA